jgi:hypothetical protein
VTLAAAHSAIALQVRHSMVTVSCVTADSRAERPRCYPKGASAYAPAAFLPIAGAGRADAGQLAGWLEAPDGLAQWEVLGGWQAVARLGGLASDGQKRVADARGVPLDRLPAVISTKPGVGYRIYDQRA